MSDNGKSSLPAEGVQVLSEEAIEEIAALYQRRSNDICCICGRPIQMQIFRNTGVCCEDHRKDRDNDHLPFKGGQLNA